MYGRIAGISINELKTPNGIGYPEAWWTLTERHGGDAPDSVKDALIGVPLPVRGRREILHATHCYEILSRRGYFIPDAMEFSSRDVIKSLLVATQNDAASFWYFHAFQLGPTMLNFEMERGTFIPTEEAQARFPLLALYDNGALTELDMRSRDMI